MLRTQIYLTADQKARLEAIAKSKSVSMADVVRDAVSSYLANNDSELRLSVLRDTFGAIGEWKDHDGVSLARSLREQWERPLDGTEDDPNKGSREGGDRS
jgi:hypothetical protein